MANWLPLLRSGDAALLLVKVFDVQIQELLLVDSILVRLADRFPAQSGPIISLPLSLSSQHHVGIPDTCVRFLIA